MTLLITLIVLSMAMLALAAIAYFLWKQEAKESVKKDKGVYDDYYGDGMI